MSLRSRIRAETAPAWLLLGVLVGCHAAAPSTIPPMDQSCTLTGGGTRAAFSIAVGQTADPAHAPIAHDPGERLVFRQLFETLVVVDCKGRVLPALAESWSVLEQGRVWQFRLRPDATFWDGSRVTARAVAESWALLSNASPRTASFSSVTVLGDYELRVDLTSASPHAQQFAHSDLAVARRVPGSAWPLGSGAFQPDTSTDPRTLRVVARAPADSFSATTITFRIVSNGDPRRALDAGVDALISADPVALEYARALPDYAVSALPWNRTYALLTPARQQPVGASEIPAEVQLSLARDAVRADTRAAEPPFLWRECRAPSAPQPSSFVHNSNAVVFLRGDALGRAIAERLVALAWPATRAPEWLRALLPDDYGQPGAPTAAGLDARALQEALRTGNALGIVVALPRVDGATCALVDDAMALALTASNAWQVTHLLDARNFLIHRRGPGRVLIDGDGTLRFGSYHP